LGLRLPVQPRLRLGPLPLRVRPRVSLGVRPRVGLGVGLVAARRHPERSRGHVLLLLLVLLRLLLRPAAEGVAPVLALHRKLVCH